jgi:hypothetical protein
VVKIALAMLLAVGFLAVGSVAMAANPPNYPTGAIELKYYANGPWAVTSTIGAGCCDTTGHKFDLWYPTNLGANGFRHPIVTWGNGTSATPSQYAYLLSHLASWGFVVIASESPTTGTGQEILDAANYAVARNSDPSSIFFGVLATSRIGAAGHSQGASGVINAMMKSNGAITTTIPIELPAQMWCATNTPTCADTRNLTGGSMFLVNGTADGVISPSTQLLPWQTAGLQSNAAYYDAAPASVAKVWGTLIGPNHNDVQGQPDCAAASSPCVNGVYGYLGYPTAWLMDRLQGDTYAHGAFITGTGELFHETTNWSNQASNIAS